jgi:hypothetical protein
MMNNDPARDPLKELTGQLPLASPPDSVWSSIEAALDDPARLPRGAAAGRRWQGLALAAAALLAVAAGVFWYTQRPNAWDVVRLDAPGGPSRMSEGQWLDTPADRGAKIQIGTIGSVDVEPNTRMRLVSARPDEHRLAMSRGKISAQILAPPRLFFVETPASVVVDLGCAYTMEVDETGVGMLRVTSGWAALEWDLRESLVPAGASCPTRPDVGPGTPCFDDASERLREALLRFDFGEKGPGEGTLETILSEARVRDTLTLWHLLERVSPADRGLVFDRIVALAPLPAGVTREAALALDTATLTRWREELAWLW